MKGPNLNPKYSLTCSTCDRKRNLYFRNDLKITNNCYKNNYINQFNWKLISF